MKKNEVEISVIISLYGYKYAKNLEAVIKSINEQTVNTEVIVSEQGEDPNSIFKCIAEKMGAKYLLTKPDYENGKALYNIGKVRNVGASIAKGEYIYFSDADILMYDTDFLEHVLCEMKKHSKISICRPLMYRLSIESLEEFISDYMKNSTVYFSIEDKTSCFVEYQKGRIQSVWGGEVQELVNGMPHVCTKYDFENVINNKDFDYTKIEEFIWAPAFHYGGSIYKRDIFWKVGGYCESYYNWGLEDEDIHWKLKETTGLLYMFNCMQNDKLIHFEHKRNYNNSTYERNRKIYEGRVEKGVVWAIDNDVNNENTFANQFLNKKWEDIKQIFIIGYDFYQK